MKRITLAFLLLLSSCALWAQKDTTLWRNTEKVARTLYYIQSHYVDTVDLDRITDAVLEGIVKELDPHSNFIPSNKVAATNEQLDGAFEGVGVEFAIISDTLTVQAVIPGGPCESAGVLPGDKIVEVDGENIAGVGLTNDGVRSRLRGPKGSKVNLTILRHGEPLLFTIRRDTIPIESIDAAYIVDKGIAYLKVSRFAQNTPREFVDALGRIAPKRPEGIIIDLRGNGGGFMISAIALADIFLKKGQTIVRTEGPEVDREDVAQGLGFYSKGPVVLLVDENSASSSEILAGALQDWDRAVIVGRRTFGKGLVQRDFRLPDGSEVRLTVARYHTPSGRVLQTPYEEGNRESYYNKSRERYARGESFHRDSIHVADSLQYKTLRLGRTVYGGGGIIPDVFVPSDTTGVNRFLIRVVGSGRLTEYAADYGDKNREELSVKDFDAFNKLWKKRGDEAYAGLLAYCAEKGIEPSSPEEAAACEALLRTRLKAQIARIPLGMTGYWQVINSEWDPEFKKAVEIVKGWKGDFPTGL